jgi:hypothetical protein
MQDDVYIDPMDDVSGDDPNFKVRKHLHRSECPICQAGAFGMKFTRDFHTRPDVHARDLAIHFNMTEEEVMDHINCHELVVSVQPTTTGELKKKISSADFYLDEISTLYMAIKDCFEFINQDRENYDSVKIQQLTTLTKDLKESLKLMAELQGRLKGPGDAQQKVLKVEGNLNIMYDIISGGVLCPHCEEKVMKKLEKVEHLIE